jgi:hypothetical protein
MGRDTYRPKTLKEIEEWERRIEKEDEEYVERLKKASTPEELRKNTVVVQDENE